MYLVAIIFNRVVPAFLFRFRYFTIFQLDTSLASHPENTKGVQFSKCIPAQQRAVSELTSFAPIQSISGTNQAWQACLESNASDNQLVAGCWTAKAAFDEADLGLRFLLQPDQAWVFSALVAKSHRGKRIFPQLLRFLMASLGEEDVHRMYAAVNPVNLASMRVFQAHCVDRIGAVMALRILRVNICLAFGNVTSESWFSLDSNANPIKLTINGGSSN